MSGASLREQIALAIRGYGKHYKIGPGAALGIADSVLAIPHIRRALAAGTHRAETSETSARAEGCQSGPKGNAHA